MAPTRLLSFLEPGAAVAVRTHETGVWDFRPDEEGQRDDWKGVAMIFFFTWSPGRGSWSLTQTPC